MKMPAKPARRTLAVAAVVIAATVAMPGTVKAQAAETPEARDERMMRCFFAPSKPDPATESEMEKAAWQGNPAAQFDMGRSYYYEGPREDHKLAFYWFCTAGVNGHPFAEYWVGLMYLNGDAVPASEEAAIWWLSQAAQRNLPEAQYELGHIAERVEAVVYPDTYRGPAPDYVAARKWYSKAADSGYAPAQRQLGALYLSGRGGPADSRQAADLLTKAARQGDTQAEYMLGVFYFSGNSSPAEKIEGYAWVYLARLSGGQGGGLLYSNTLADMATKMTPDQLAAARTRADELNREIQSTTLRH